MFDGSGGNNHALEHYAVVSKSSRKFVLLISWAMKCCLVQSILLL